MTCKKVSYWMQLYTDGRLERARLTHLERHLAECPACRQELTLLECIRNGARETASESELVPEPADLTRRILDRVAAYEARRATRSQEWWPGVARWAAGWRGAAGALVILTVLALLQPGAFAAFTHALSQHAASAYILLMTPGPDSIIWGVWGAGALVAGALTIWFMRADASSGWRRAIAQRLPQLW